MPGLRRRGSNAWAKCPLHRERTPSFHVTLKNLLWYCHGCGVGGDAIDLVMRLHHFSFRQAAIYLGAWAEAVSEDDRRRIERERRERDQTRVERDRYDQVERALLRRNRNRLHILERLVRSLAQFLTTFDPASREADECWELMRLAHEFIRERAAAYTLLAFGSESQRRAFVSGHDGQILDEVLSVGFVVDDYGHRRELLL